MNLRIASYNLRKCKGSDGRRDPDRVVSVINALAADVIALQEVDLRMGARPAALPATLITAETDFLPVSLAGTGPDSLGWHGQTVLVRRGLSVQGVTPLPLPGWEPRGALAVDLMGAAGVSFRLIAAHLGLRRSDRRAQWARLRDALETAEGSGAIIGDFNEWSASRGFEPLQGLAVHAPGRSFPARAPMAMLDRIVLGPGLALTRAGVLDTALARTASDHLPIWGDITGFVPISDQTPNNQTPDKVAAPTSA
ncbi:endonuclease/exonuclease/phosphatase family protein [Phaeovulum sp.]|uniref:endonuclease/exonuclease/phosphatase family protein n=1 Tax=Phaeovulum sp. TaxID=2934796 RepID=UPI0039E5CE7B